jgi:predicted metal-dependent phosphoesterase TrpH
MKKIDFHIHTKKSISDKEFEFDIEKEYVEIAKLDAIAITNHNLFDKNQFDEIKENLGIKVFPGVEVNLENGHILLIADEEYEEELERLCSQLSNYIIEQGDTLSYDVFQGIFSDLSNFIVIPHYKKDPVLDTDTLNKLTDNIIVGEVSSPKKWERMYKDKNEKLNPVLFSDVRIDKNIKSFPVKQTYIDCDELTVPKIKLVFADKNKIAISMSL